MNIRVLGRVLVEAQGASTSFEGIREVTGLVDHVRRDTPAAGPEWVRRMRIRCRTGDRLRTGSECVSCRRFVNYVPVPLSHSVTVRCRWTDEDMVSDIMTPVCALVTAPRDATVGAARELAREHGLSHLVVTDHGVLVGILELARVRSVEATDGVARHMTRRLWIIPPMASLADVVEIVRQHGVECLPVVERGALRGVVTRAHLDGSGVGHAIAV